MSFEDNRPFWKEFMALYREKPCLWDIKNKEYWNKSTRNAAYNSLVRKSKEVFPGANKDFVIKKISSFRSSFRRQVRRIQSAQRSGETDEVPEVTLWYFHLLLFLLDQEERSNVMPFVRDENFNEEIQVRQQTILQWKTLLSCNCINGLIFSTFQW